MLNSTGSVVPTKQINDPQRLLTEVEQTIVVAVSIWWTGRGTGLWDWTEGLDS